MFNFSIGSLHLDLGVLHFFLGIEVLHNDDNMHISQFKYVNKLISKARLASTKTLYTPICSKVLLTIYEGVYLNDPTLYRSIIVAL